MYKSAKPRANRALATKRALEMYNVLAQREASKQELIDAVKRNLRQNPYGASPEDSFEKDKQFLAQLNVRIRYDKRQNVYHLQTEEEPLLRLPLTLEEIDLLPLLMAAFASTPFGDRVRRLIEKLERYLETKPLSPSFVHPLLPLALAQAQAQAVDFELLRELMRATRLSYVVEFDYQSPRKEKPIHHIIEPYDSLEVREGHIYFEGHNLRWNADMPYRVDRIVRGSFRQSGKKFAQRERKRELLPLRYKLNAVIARHGATPRFSGHREERLADGSVIVSAQVTKAGLWWASKTLLKYGENCVVLEPPELVAEIKRIVAQMAENYGNVVV